MKKIFKWNHIVILFSILSVSLCFTNCKKTENPIKYLKGTFPDTVINMTDINSAFDDYNTTCYQLTGDVPILFSSNRASSGGQFDLEQAIISYVFDQTNGSFGLGAHMYNDAFFSKLIDKAKTPGNDFGPYSLFSPIDGYEYLLLSSVNGTGNLDFYYLKNRPVFGNILSEIDGPFPIKLLNTSSDDAYICLDLNMDSAYFSSSINGNFDIYVHNRPAEKDLATWFNSNYEISAKVDSINSASDDKCPFIIKNVMFFTSNRPGGLGGYDLYYSVLRKGKWSSPVNMGPDINTSYDEYRPVIGSDPEFMNQFMIFSSNRPGGKGGFDLYFKGIELPK